MKFIKETTQETSGGRGWKGKKSFRPSGNQFTLNHFVDVLVGNENQILIFTDLCIDKLCVEIVSSDSMFICRLIVCY